MKKSPENVSLETKSSVFRVDSEIVGVRFTIKLGYKSVEAVVMITVDRAGGIFHCD